AEAAEDATEFPEWEECRAKAKAQIDGLLLSFASLRQTLKRRQRLVEGAGRLPVGRSGQSLVAGLTEVRDRLLPQLTPHRMVSQPLDVLRQSVGIRTLDGADDPCVQGLAPLVQQSAVGDFMGERVLEGVLRIRKEAWLVQDRCRW